MNTYQIRNLNTQQKPFRFFCHLVQPHGRKIANFMCMWSVYCCCYCPLFFWNFFYSWQHMKIANFLWNWGLLKFKLFIQSNLV